MSLNVSATLLDEAARGEVDDDAFVDCIRTSLPYAWDLISGLAARFNAGSAPLAVNDVPPPTSAPAASCCGRWPATASAAPSSGISA